MRKGENIRSEISFNGVDGLSSPELIQAIRNKAFEENKTKDPHYMATLASLCFAGPALKWFEHLDDDVQGNWSQLRRALLAQFPDGQDDTGTPPLFAGETPKECEDFIRSVRKHSHAEGKAQDDKWMADYAASRMTGSALKWHTKLDSKVRHSWSQVERALLAYFPDPPPYVIPPAGRVLINQWEPTKALLSPRSEAEWLRGARERRAAYNQTALDERSSVYWFLVEAGENTPEATIQTGHEPNGVALFSARTWYEGGLHPGKSIRGWKGSIITFSGREVHIPPPYEILVGNKSAVQWIGNPWTPEKAQRAPSILMKPFNAVEGGFETDGMALLLVQSYREDCGWQPGTTDGRGQSCEIGWNGKVLLLPNFRILVWVE